MSRKYRREYNKSRVIGEKIYTGIFTGPSLSKHDYDIAHSEANYSNLRSFLINNLEQLVFDFISSYPHAGIQSVDEYATCFTETSLLLYYARIQRKITATAEFLSKRIWLIAQAREFSNHSELMQMYLNLESSTQDDSYIYSKLFSLYKEFYSNSFSWSVDNLIEFSNILRVVKNIGVFEENTARYKIIFESYAHFSSIPQYDYETIVRHLNNPELRQKAESANFAHGVNKSLYIAFSKYISMNYDIKQLICLIVNSSYTISVLNETTRLYNAEQERQRLLRGDMSYEKNLTAQQLDLANVETGAGFENFLVNVFTRIGYLATTTKGSGDKGADLILRRNGQTYVVQAKFYSKPVGNKAIQEAHTAKDIYKADGAAVVTNNSFTKQAVEDAKSLNVILIDGNKLNSLIDVAAHGNKTYDVFR